MRRIHLINPLENAHGGSEARTLELFRMLKDVADVRLWANGPPDPRLAASFPITRIAPARGRFPITGTFVFVGVYYWLTSWIRLARPRRRIIIYNTIGGGELPGFIGRVAGSPASCEVLYASEETARDGGLPGQVQLSPIDLARFHPAPRAQRRFTIGRLSRDTPYKFHPDDPAFFAGLAEAGAEVRLMGATCLASALAGTPGITLLPAGAEPSETFLQGLDCFIYRTDPAWTEALGRVILEAMACAVPVVCEARGGCVEFIRSGENGFLFRTDAEAHAQIAALRADPALAARLGQAGRATVEAMYGERYTAELREFYIR